VKRLLGRSRAVGKWLVEGWWWWSGFLVLSVALLVSIRSGTSELKIRVSGLALQWFGVATVAYGLRETRKMFGRPRPVTSLRAWLSRFPSWGRREVMEADTLLVGVSASAAVSRPWSPVDPDSPIEARVGALTKNVEQLNERLTAAENNLDRLAREHADALRGEKQVRAEHDDALQAKLEAAETGGLYISLIGVICLFFGLLLTSVPKEIAQLLR
jgi:hypothetical protein